MNELLSSLNSSQLAAVTYLDGPELVIAGAGSGKTRVLTYKIAYMISQGVKPWQILALTFTNKAAREMKDRIGSLLGNDVSRYLQMGTFHSVFLRILRIEAEYVGLKPNFTIYDDSDSKSLVNAIIKELGLDDKTYKSSTILSRIGMAKNSLIMPEEYLADSSLMERDMRGNVPQLGRIYQLYVERCKHANAVDFDDMLVYTYLLFAEHKEICQKYAERFAYVLVDEFQDTNQAQQRIITLLTQGRGNICVVGDDAQSIYAFRGANIDNILNFQNMFQGTKIFKLEQNYRSTQNIVQVANSLIAHNQRQITKNVFSDNQKGDKVRLDITYSDKEEVGLVCRNIRILHKIKHIAYRGMAILYRTNAQSRLFEEELRKLALPYRIYGGQSFYQRKEIKDIIAYFRLVINEADDEALRRAINYPKRGIGNTTIGKITNAARAAGVSLWRVASNPVSYGLALSAATERKVAGFVSLIQSFMADSSSLDAYVLGKRIISESGITMELASDTSTEGKDRMANVDEFVSGLSDFVDSKREEGFAEEVYVGHFLQEVSLLTDFDVNDAEDGDMDKVSLMTVHASKGLEFDSVFIVGLEENIFPSQRSLSSIRELEEERRLFYVAITRAKEHCFITCAKSRYHFGSMQFNMPSRFLKEIDSRLLDVNGGTLGENRIETNVPNYDSEKKSLLRQRTFTPVPQVMRQPNVSVSESISSHSLPIGTRIEHQRFGIGEVIRVEGCGENEKAVVNFNNVGQKTLLLKFAKFKLL